MLKEAIEYCESIADDSSTIYYLHRKANERFNLSDIESDTLMDILYTWVNPEMRG